MDLQLSDRRPDLVIVYKKKKKKKKRKRKRTCLIVDFAVPADHRQLKESEKRDKYLKLARELKKLWDMKVTVIPIVTDVPGTRTGGLRNNRMSGDHPNYSIVEISQNTEKSPGILKRLAVTQTPVKKTIL